jgi:hypothetical protein
MIIRIGVHQLADAQIDKNKLFTPVQKARASSCTPEK